ncbi:MAG TPA: 7TM diverse intracellular signaling domain-containing protein, partial [Thermoanaerobaculia bacterium]|nr:7TM diverse intracellular signaling domain-containing protein [Thermoanaerobaculia bacterium]
MKPALAPEDRPPEGWPGSGWFRRHFLVDPGLQGRPVALRVAAPGTADVYLDGRLVLSLGKGPAPEIPSERREAALVTFEGRTHVLAVRYAFPNTTAGRAGAGGEIGFRLSLADPSFAPTTAPDRPWLTGLQGALVGLPLFLALLHLALFSFDPRGRENLFYSVEMAAFTVILLREFRGSLLATEAQRDFLDKAGRGAPVVAMVFGLLFYYAIRTNPFPRNWRPLVAAGAGLLLAAYLAPNAMDWAWPVYFLAIVAEVFRVERFGRTVPRKGARIFLRSFALFGVIIVLQILVDFGLLKSVAG